MHCLAVRVGLTTIARQDVRHLFSCIRIILIHVTIIHVTLSLTSECSVDCSYRCSSRMHHHFCWHSISSLLGRALVIMKHQGGAKGTIKYFTRGVTRTSMVWGLYARAHLWCGDYYQEYITPRVCNCLHNLYAVLRRQNFTSRDMVQKVMLANSAK